MPRRDAPDFDDDGRPVQSVPFAFPDDEPPAKDATGDPQDALMRGFRAAVALLEKCRTDTERRATLIALSAFIHKSAESVGTLARRARCHRITMQRKVSALKATAGIL